MSICEVTEGEYTVVGCGDRSHSANCLHDLDGVPPVPIRCSLTQVTGGPEAIEAVGAGYPWTGAQLADCLEWLGERWDRYKAGQATQEAITAAREHYAVHRGDPIRHRGVLYKTIQQLSRSGLLLPQVAEALGVPLDEIVGRVSSGAWKRDDRTTAYVTAEAILRSGDLDSWKAVERRAGVGEKTAAALANFLGVTPQLRGAGNWRNPPEVLARVHELHAQGVGMAAILRQVKAEMPEPTERLTYAAVHAMFRTDRVEHMRRSRERRRLKEQGNDAAAAS